MRRAMMMTLGLLAVAIAGCEKKGSGMYEVQRPVVGTVTDTIHTPTVSVGSRKETVSVPTVKVTKDSATISVPKISVHKGTGH